MDREFSVFDMLRIIISNWLLIILVGCLGAGATYYATSKMKSWYGYSILARVPAYKLVVPEASKNADPLGKLPIMNKETKSEISTFMSFHYFDNPEFSENKAKQK